MIYKQQDVVLVPFLFTDASTVKARPVLIISNDKLNLDFTSADFVGIAITSKIRKTSYSVQIANPDFKNGSIPGQSEIQCCKIATIQKDKIIKKLGTLNDVIFATVLKCVDQVFH